jgi:hypothetical protein
MQTMNLWRRAHHTLWTLDAMLLILIYTVLLLILPVPKTTRPVSGR